MPKGQENKTSAFALIMKKILQGCRKRGCLWEGGNHYSSSRTEIGESELIGCFWIVFKTAEKGEDGSQKEVTSRGGRG